jgi:sortase (surface protein transpeptidase)
VTSARTAAARWIAGQASADAIVSCDPQMCAPLQAQGIPAARLLALGGSNPDPLGSDLIVSTAAVRREFGARLASVYAPVSLASFGTGAAQTAVRVVAADGGAAYLRSLRADVAARAAAGRQLLHNPRLRPSAPARQALAAGQVDSRLLTVFAALATMHRVDVVGFPVPAAGASPGMPLRVADIAPAPAPDSSPATAAPAPVSLTIPAIGVHTRLIRLGVTAQGTLQVPASTTVAGWYTGSPRPGEIGSSVIAGHIDSYQGPGIFYRLSHMRPGERIYVRRANGSLAVFRVYAVREYPKDHFPTGTVYGPAPDAELHLITCGGTFDYATHSYLSNVVVYSTQAG